MNELNFDMESFNRALAAKGLPPITAEEFYGVEEEKAPKPMTAKQRTKQKSRRKMQRQARKVNRGKK